MKKIISTCIALMVSAACSISAFAMEVPTNTTIQDLNGVRQYSISPNAASFVVKEMVDTYRMHLLPCASGQ